MGGSSTLVADTSTVTGWDANEADGVDELDAVGGGGDELAGPDTGGGGNGKGKGDPGPGEKAVLLNWLFWPFICPIIVLSACCIAYFWKHGKQHAEIVNTH